MSEIRRRAVRLDTVVTTATAGAFVEGHSEQAQLVASQPFLVDGQVAYDPLTNPSWSPPDISS